MTTDLPLVSVIIPAFNRVQFIRDTIESVLHQDYRPFELIVVDDGSTDGTFELLESFAPNVGFHLYTHPNHLNRGQSASLNLGLAKARGKYIAILDSDDMFAPGKLQREVDYLEAHQDIGLVYERGAAVDEQGNFLFFTLPDDHVETGDANRLLLNCFIALPGGSMIRKSAFDRAGAFEESFRASQDHDMALRLFETCSVAYLPEVAFYYRKHHSSISVNGLKTRWTLGFEIVRRASDRYPYARRTIRKRHAVLNYRMGQTLWREGSRVNALGYLLKSALLDPSRALQVLLGFESTR